MNKKKLAGIVLGSAAILGLLSACGGKKEDAGANSNEDRDLRVWATYLQPSTTVSSWKESPFHTGLAEASGIDVEWEFPTEGTDGDQAFNLMLADDSDLPDILGYGLRNDAEQYLDDGIIQDLSDVLEEKAPNYWKFLQENPELAKAVKTDDGRYYAFGIFREDPAQGSFYGPEIRTDWLEEQGLKMPTNADEWENVLKVFKDKYGAQMSFDVGSMNLSGFSGAFGAYGTFGLSYYLDENNKVQVAQAQTEWKDYMTWLNKLYKEGLIDPDFVTIDDEGIKTKVANDKVGATFNLGSRVAIYEDQAKSNGKTSSWAWAPYPNQADGTPTASFYTSGQVQAPVWTVTKAASGKMLDKALEWLDFAYSDEGSVYWNFGKEGESWENVDGRHVWTDKILNNELGYSEAKVLYTGLSNTGLGVQRLETLATTKDPITTDDIAGGIWDNGNEKARKTVLPSAITKTSEESKEAANIANTIDIYCSENALKFVTGEKSLDEFDDFVKEMENQGLERLLEINQAAYDRYLKR